MAGVYHGRGNWIEIDGSTITRTEKLEEKLSDCYKLINHNGSHELARDMYTEGFAQGLEWVKQNSSSYGGE